MNISNKSLKLLNVVISSNPKHSPKGHPCDYNRWIKFIVSTYINDDSVDPWELYDYLIKNGFKKFTEEAKELTEHYIIITDFINCILDYKNNNITLESAKKLIEDFVYFIK